MIELDDLQRGAIDSIYGLIDDGERRILVVAPTGFGKTRIMAALLADSQRGGLYTHRRLLLQQTSEVLTREGIEHGVRAAGYSLELDHPIQLCSTQTEASRVFKKHKYALHFADVSLVDEAHVQKGETMRKISERQVEAGGAVIGFTATATDLGGDYDELVSVCGTRDAIEIGRLVAARHYAPDEPDYKQLEKNRNSSGEFLKEDVTKAMMKRSIFGRVISHWRTLNPEGRPTLLFAPGVEESQWFANEFHKAGIPAAHIDGNKMWIKGDWHETHNENRAILRRQVESGEVQVVCNRFVMREGVNWPFLYCGILATAFGSLSSYLQSCGRLLRADEEKDHALIIDHGGNWHRHGSINENRDWFLDRSEYVASVERIERFRSNTEPEPICCYKCQGVRRSGPVCPYCGYASTASRRWVVQWDGSLRETEAKIYPPRARVTDDRYKRDWIGCYYRCLKTGRTFRQAEGLFCYEHRGLFPKRGWPFQPKNELDWFEKIKDVPRSKLS